MHNFFCICLFQHPSSSRGRNTSVLLCLYPVESKLELSVLQAINTTVQISLYDWTAVCSQGKKKNQSWHSAVHWANCCCEHTATSLVPWSSFPEGVAPTRVREPPGSGKDPQVIAYLFALEPAPALWARGACSQPRKRAGRGAAAAVRRAQRVLWCLIHLQRSRHSRFLLLPYQTAQALTREGVWQDDWGWRACPARTGLGRGIRPAWRPGSSPQDLQGG